MKKRYDFSKGKRGPVIPLDPNKTRITIRLDTDIVAWFRDQVNRAGGGNYQRLINEALRQRMMDASRRVRGESMRVNAQFDAIEDAPDALQRRLHRRR